jgi:hypothetical protein
LRHREAERLGDVEMVFEKLDQEGRLWGALVISLISAVVAAYCIYRANNLWKRMGLHGWTFTASWEALVFAEICRIAELGSGAMWLEIVAFGLATVALLVYGQRTIVMSVEAQPDADPRLTRWALL